MKKEFENAVVIGGHDGAYEFLRIMNRPIDIEENTEASEYVVNNYDKLLNFVRNKCGNKIADPAEMVNEVWGSIKNSEQIGSGYDPNKGTKDGLITVAQFVYGRLSKYCLNVMYRTQGALYRYEDEYGESVNSTDGLSKKIKELATNGKKKVVRNKHADVEIVASISEDMTRLYENSHDDSTARAFDRIDDFNSIRGYIEELFNYDDERISMKPFLENLLNVGREDVSIQQFRQTFNGLIEFVGEQDYFKDALFEVMSFAMKYPDEYRAVVASINY